MGGGGLLSRAADTEPAGFEEHLHSALRCLYDHARLESHPLAAPLGPAAGRTLRRLLLDAIQELKPASDTPRESPDWQHYQYLYLRYVEARPVAEVADDLAVGERQTRRRQRDALAALAALLWPRWRALASPEPLDARSEPPFDGAVLGQELARLDSAEPSAAVDLAALGEIAVATVARLAERAGSAVAFARPAESLLAVGNPIVLRQAVLDGLVCALRRAGRAPIEVTLVSADGTARLTIRAVGAQPGAPEPDEPELAELRQLLTTQHGALELRRGGSAWTLTLVFPAGEPRTVLVVDDSDDIRQLFRRYLSGTSYRVVEARGGDEGLDLLARVRPACVILDVMMPARDGWEVLQTLRSHPETADVPVVVCTVLRQRELALSLGATGYLAKPVTRAELLGALQDATAVARAR